MRAGAPSAVMASSSAAYGSSVASWRGATLLAASVPIAGGRVVWRASQDVQDTLTLRVPRVFEGFDWLPGETDYLHPLAKMGQELSVRVTVTSDVTGVAYDTLVGRFQIQDVEESSPGMVTVRGAGVLQVVADDKLPTPTPPRAGGTLFSEFRRLLPLGVSAAIASTLVDRACPQSLAWSEDRLAALKSIADAVPALLRSDPTGQVMLKPPLAAVPVPVITLSTGDPSPSNPSPVVMGKSTQQTREGIYNSWVVHGAATDDPTRFPVQGSADQTSGPFAVDPLGFRTRRAFFASPLLTTEAQCNLAAQTRLANGLRGAAVIPVEMVPDPRLELDDAVRLLDERGDDGVWGFDVTGYLVGVDLPLTIDDGPMRLDVGVG